MNSVIEAIKQNSLMHPNKTALVCGNSEISYSQLYTDIVTFASNIKATGAKKGSRIILEADNLIHYFTALLGCQLAGCIAVPIEKNVSIYKLQEILKTVKPCLIFMKTNGESYTDFLKPAECARFRLPKPTDIATIVYTTGTTGTPVFISHSHKSIVAAIENLITGTCITVDDVILSDSLYYVSVGIRRTLSGLFAGATVIMHDSELNTDDLKRIINSYGVTHMAIAYSNFKILLDTTDTALKASLERVNCVESLSGPLTSVNIKDFHKTYPGVILYNVYGTAEAGCLLINNTKENSDEGCIGKPTCNTKIILLDENGETVTKPGVYGKVAVKSSANMAGYYRKKALTEEVMHNDYIKINDIAYFDKDGYFYFVSRVGDIIDVKGNKIIPSEIEYLVKTYDGVTDCAFVAVQGARDIQIPVLYISVTKGFEFDGLKAFLASKIEDYKIPEEIIITDTIPRTPTGKIMRKALEINKPKI